MKRLVSCSAREIALAPPNGVSPAARYISEDFGSYRLAGRILQANDSAGWPPLLAIHGARSDCTRLDPLLLALQALGIGSLGVNLSGHHEASPIPLHATSLGQNLTECLRFAARPGPALRAVLGHSLGGALALMVAEAHQANVRAIALVCPALYPEAAYVVPAFGPLFRQALSIPFEFMGSRSLRFLRDFDGQVMLVIGEFDGLAAGSLGGTAGRSAGLVTLEDWTGAERRVNSAIPAEVIAALQDAVPAERLTQIVLPGCDHAVPDWLRAHPSKAQQLAGDVARWLREAGCG